MNLRYQIADASQAPLIYAQAKALIDTYEDLSCIDYEKVLGWMKSKITRDISRYTAVYLADRVCGFYCLREDGELDDLYVLPEFQGQGVGSRILKTCIETSRNPLYLYVFSRNTRAIAFYERFGFAFRETVSKTRQIMCRNG